MMSTILSEKDLTFKTFEQAIFNALCSIARNFFAQFLEKLDSDIAAARDKTVYRSKGKRRTTVKTVFGEVSFARNVYETTGNGEKCFVYLLDESLQMKETGLLSANLKEKMLNMVTELSYRETAARISETTGQTVSAATVWNLVQAFGLKAEERSRKLVEANKEGRLAGEKEAPILFEEADGTYINMQGKDRVNCEKGKAEVKISLTYSGWEEVSKGRYRLRDRLVTAGIYGAKEFRKTREAVIANTFDLDGTQLRILNGDGAAWIKKGRDKDTVFQLDPFHKHQAIRKCITNKKAAKDIVRLLDAGDVEGTLHFIDMYANGLENEEEEAAARYLYAYFADNRDGLIPYDKRGIELPKAPDGVVYRQLGTMESHVRGVIAKRMKHNQTSWSRKGCNSMCSLLAMKASGLLEELTEDRQILLKEIEIEEREEDEGTILSSFQVGERVGRGYEYPRQGHLTLPGMSKNALPFAGF